jgi:DNA-binding transcriptional ArsR family regulator
LTNISVQTIIIVMTQPDIEYLEKLDRVSVLLHPLRLQIMNLAVGGTSATEAARKLGLPRQMVHYHVLALERAGLLIPLNEVRRRNMVERRVQSSAKSYLIDPDILGALSPGRRRFPDPATPEALLRLTAKVQTDLSRLAASPPATPLPVLSLSSRIHFSSDEQRAGFVRALGDAVSGTIRDFAASAADPPTAAGEASTLVLALYPLPRSHNPTGSQGDAPPV